MFRTAKVDVAYTRLWDRKTYATEYHPGRSFIRCKCVIHARRLRTYATYGLGHVRRFRTYKDSSKCSIKMGILMRSDTLLRAFLYPTDLCMKHLPLQYETSTFAVRNIYLYDSWGAYVPKLSGMYEALAAYETSLRTSSNRRACMKHLQRRRQKGGSQEAHKVSKCSKYLVHNTS